MSKRVAGLIHSHSAHQYVLYFVYTVLVGSPELPYSPANIYRSSVSTSPSSSWSSQGSYPVLAAMKSVEVKQKAKASTNMCLFFGIISPLFLPLVVK